MPWKVQRSKFDGDQELDSECFSDLSLRDIGPKITKLFLSREERRFKEISVRIKGDKLICTCSLVAAI